jgi:hypothetical protein
VTGPAVSRERDGLEGSFPSRSPGTAPIHARGKGSAYRYDQGCRCGQCREAKRVKRKRARDRSRDLNTASYQRELATSRALKERYRGTCRECGKPTTGSDGPQSGRELCVRCSNTAIGASRRGSGAHAAAIRAALADGPLRLRDLIDQTGLDRNNLSQDLLRLMAYSIVVRVSRGVYALATEAT